MAYGSSGGGSGGSGAGASGSGETTFKGFSSRANQQNFKLYDFEVAKQDLINRLSVRKGERVENPEFGTIIYDAIFEPLNTGNISFRSGQRHSNSGHNNICAAQYHREIEVQFR